MSKALSSLTYSWYLGGLTCFQPLLPSWPLPHTYCLRFCIILLLTQSLSQLSACTMSSVISQQEEPVSSQKLLCFLFLKMRIMQFIMHSFFVLAARKLRAKLCTQSAPANCFWYTLFLIFTFNSFFFKQTLSSVFPVDRGIDNIWKAMQFK